MSVQVKTPTKSQFEIKGYPCGEHTTEEDRFNQPPKQKPNKDVSFEQRNVPEFSHRNSVSRGDKPREFQFRKRRYSMPQRLADSSQGSHTAFMKRKKFLIDMKTSGKKIILPTKFLLGGNINDPLNLNSLYHDEEGKVLNEKTPVSSPLPTPLHRQNVVVVIPPNITDPLNLDADDESFVSKMLRKRKRSYRHKRKDSSTVCPPVVKELDDKKQQLMEALKIEIDTDNEPCPDISSEDLALDIRSASTNLCSDQIVSPVVPQVSPKMRRRRKTISECSGSHEPPFDASRSLFPSTSLELKVSPKKAKRPISYSKIPYSSTADQYPTFAKNPKYIYGNYNRYYGYRNPTCETDHRLEIFESEWFECKDVLDIGCNVGHLTASIARDYRPRKIVGMDIDGQLIGVARKNIQHYLAMSKQDTSKYPTSSSINYGPMAAPSVGKQGGRPEFPNNLLFIQGNIVLESDDLLAFQEEEYDIILALSITKWIHLNSGDEGLKRMFKRIFIQLRPGGKLILEPQPWASYRKRKKLNEAIFKNYQNIKLKPEHFSNYLLNEIGFSKCEVIGVPFNKSKGFRRPLQLYTKADTNSNTPHTDVEEIAGTSHTDQKVTTA